MNEPGYLALFGELHFSRIQKRALLKHPRGLPALYFNASPCFRGGSLGVIGPQQKKDDTPRLMTLVPRRGRERKAFVSVIGRP